MSHMKAVSMIISSLIVESQFQRKKILKNRVICIWNLKVYCMVHCQSVYCFSSFRIVNYSSINDTNCIFTFKITFHVPSVLCLSI